MDYLIIAHWLKRELVKGNSLRIKYKKTETRKNVREDKRNKVLTKKLLFAFN
jgi:hypothetical protein